MELVVAVAAAFGCLGLISFAVMSQVQERQTVKSSLRQLDDYQVEDQRTRDLQQPLSERLAGPFMKLADGASKRLWPPEYVATAKKKLLVAGFSGQDAVDRFLAIRIAGIAAIPVWFILILGVLGLSGKVAFGCIGLLALLGVIGPQAWLDRKTAERQLVIRKALPDILDLLTISVEAGLGFEQALDRVVQAVPGPLATEFTRMLGETRAGASRSDAMRGMDERTDTPEVRSFVLAILQADTFGVSIGRILRTQAEEMRIKRRQLAQEQAQKAPIKMLIPMVFCVFPALFVVVIGPAFLNISAGF